MVKGIISTLLVLFSVQSQAIVVRHDVNSNDYLVNKAPQYFVDMPHEGQGTLIAPQWVLTVAHVIFYDYRGKTLNIGGKEYIIEDVVIHQGYKKFNQELLSLGTEAVMEFQYQNQDIALVKLTQAVDNVTPIQLYQAKDELGKLGDRLWPWRDGKWRKRCRV